ncbi:LOW QUALITY PROTEIN: coiled-coil domain-containing protein 38 [Tiliqua scincoides]|uniref:LOW QUALITY PROTEIN: coiled-coil domain-containing protein 38 n=1 Tax=Tiliqua scincoides TaxID=71010 RepID=UPI003462738F
MASTLVPQTCPPCLGLRVDDKPKSPFRSLDTEIYLYKDIECVEKEQIRIAQHNLKVYEKSTISSRARSRKALKKLEEAVEKEMQGEIEKDIPALNWALTFAKFCQSDKTSMTDYISEQKELFLLEYAVKVKRNTISKMERLAASEERKAKIAETKLEEDTIAFDEFLKENDRSSVEALKMATQEAKYKMEAMAEVKSAMSELVSLKSDITDTENQLRQYLSYEAFLLSVSPKEWQEKQIEKKKKNKEKKRASVSCVSIPVHQKPKLGVTTSFLLHQATCGSEKSISSEEDFSLDDLDSEEEPEIYFKHPQDLLKMFTELEEQNLSLFQNIQEIAGTLEDHYQKEHAIKEQKEKTIKNLVNEKEKLTASCIKEKEKRDEVALRAKVFSTQYNPEDMDKMLNALNKKVAEVYKACFITSDATGLTSFQMLKKIESRVSELCEMLETLPTEYLETIEVIEKLRAKERRQRLREQKLEELKRMQEQRLKAALARAIAAPKKMVGRKLVYRSQPPETKQGQKNAIDHTTRSEDDYYFS